MSESKVEVKRRGNSSRTLKITLGVLGVLIFGLVIAIIVVINNRGGTQDEQVAEEVTTDTEAKTEIVEERTEVETIYDGIIESIDNELSEVYVEDKDEIFRIYKQYIDITEDEQVKAMIKVDYYQMAMIYDVDKSHGEEILDELVKLDDTLKSIDSAVTVVNAADYYGNTELYNNYSAILTERTKAGGADLEMETAG